MAMEIPVISRISGFEAEINRLQNSPSLISRVFHVSGIEELFRISSLWTWGALILAFIATFGGVLRRTKLVIFRFKRKSDNAVSEPLIQTFSEDLDSDEDDETASSATSSSDGEDETSNSLFDGDSRVAGCCCNYEEDRGQKRKFKFPRRRNSESRFSWSDFVNGKRVVKSWDGLGLGLGFEDSSGSLISLWDLNKNEITSSYYSGRCQIPAVSAPSPAVIVSAGLDQETKSLALRVWDTRAGRQVPEIYTEWQPRRRKVVGIDSGNVTGDVTALAVRDIRNVASPLDGLTESDVETWWDADAVIVDGDREICRLDLSSRESVVSRCRDAVLSYLM